MEAKHKVVFRRDKDMDKNELYYAQMHLKDSALIAWPLHRHTLMKGKTTIVYFEPSTYNNDIKLISIWDIKDNGPCTGRVTITQMGLNKKYQ